MTDSPIPNTGSSKIKVGGTELRVSEEQLKAVLSSVLEADSSSSPTSSTAQQGFTDIRRQLRGSVPKTSSDDACKQLFPLFKLGYYAAQTKEKIDQRWIDPVCDINPNTDSDSDNTDSDSDNDTITPPVV